MKILWLYRYSAQYDYDNWLHLKFVEVLKRYPGIEVLVYGPEIHVGYPHLTTLPYNSALTIDDIKKHFDFDAIICNTKSRMFLDYNPHPPNKYARGQWLPKGFENCSSPKLVIEEDYHYETDDKWYQDNKIDLILQRHLSQSLRQNIVPMKWFPFSVDTSVFCPAPDVRLNKICFAGSTSKDVYRYRYFACEKLKHAGLIDVFASGQKTGYLYINCLRRYISHLCCSSIYKISPAKMFEIIASGSALFTNPNDDLELLFPGHAYYTYKPDHSDVVTVAKDIINNSAKRIDIVKRGLNIINEKHSHNIRIGELLNIIKGIK